MFNILSNKDLPFEKRKEISLNILLKHVDLTTNDTSISFVLCIIFILRAANDISSFAILMENLLKAIKNGTLSKKLARLIVRRLLKANVLVDLELRETVN